jgi:hypothetical protein
MVAVACYTAFLVVCTYEWRTSTYGSLKFTGVNGMYWELYSDDASNCQLYIEITDKGFFPISAIPKELLERETDETRTFFRRLGYRYKYRSKFGHLSLEFDQDNRLVQFRGSPDAISKSLAGPYIKLPIAYEGLHKVWGKPDSIASRREVEGFKVH